MPDINDLIAGGIRPPAVEDLATARAKQLTLSDLRQKQTMNSQKIASDAITLQQQERDQADDKAINDAMATNTAPGPDGAPKLDRDGVINDLTTAGRGQAAAKVQAGFTAQDTSRAKQIEAQNAAQTSAITLTNQRSTELARLSQAVEDAAPADKQAAYTNLHTEGLRLGLITPQMQAQFPAQYDPSQDQHIHSLTLAAQDAKTRSDLQTANLTRLKDQAEVDKDNLAKAETWRITSASQAANALNQQDLDGIRARLAASGAPPTALAQIPATWDPAAMKQLGRSAMTAEQRTQADQAAANATETKARNDATAANETAMRLQGDQRLRIEGGQLKIAQQRYGMDTAGVSPAAQMAVDGRMDPATLRMMLRSTPGLLGQIQRADPQFDEATMDNRFNTLKDFSNTSNTKAGGQVLALNTLVHHADLYMQTADALKNGTFVPGNAVYNAVASAFGSAPPTQANLVARFFAGETGKVATGGVPAEGEINGILKNLGSSASPDQIKGAGQTLLQIAAGRMIPLKERVDQAKIGNVVQVLGPDAKGILARRGFDPNTLAPAGAATPPLVSTKAQYDAVPSGATYTEPDGKTYRKP